MNIGKIHGGADFIPTWSLQERLLKAKDTLTRGIRSGTPDLEALDKLETLKELYEFIEASDEALNVLEV